MGVGWRGVVEDENYCEYVGEMIGVFWMFRMKVQWWRVPGEHVTPLC